MIFWNCYIKNRLTHENKINGFIFVSDVAFKVKWAKVTKHLLVFGILRLKKKTIDIKFDDFDYLTRWCVSISMNFHFRLAMCLFWMRLDFYSRTIAWFVCFFLCGWQGQKLWSHWHCEWGILHFLNAINRICWSGARWKPLISTF